MARGGLRFDISAAAGRRRDSFFTDFPQTLLLFHLEILKNGEIIFLDFAEMKRERNIPSAVLPSATHKNLTS